MRLVFAGTPPFAAQALQALHAAGHEIALVLTQPDRPSGRGLKPKPSAVADLAGTLRLEVAKPASLKTAEAKAMIESLSPDIMVVAAYGLILPKSVLTIPKRGCFNIHASLLPRWRGAAPIQRAIQAGDVETGVAIMAMESGLDTGAVLIERRVPILAVDTAGTLTDKLSRLGAETIVEALSRLDELSPRHQDAAGVTYAAKINKPEAVLDWQLDATVLDRQVRAFNPFPGAETILDGETLKIWEVEPIVASGIPGTVIDFDHGRPLIACGKGALALTVIQRPGSRRMAAAEFLRGRPMLPGTRLGSNANGNA
ncbi:MAG: methionyl-tRNA formyltransferase [Betaproteobacteria bacterium]|nr:methionyl-tRNA formyltransferase [Betaproteobacteria bacterium]